MPANPDKETSLEFTGCILKDREPIWYPIENTQVCQILEVILFSENCPSKKTWKAPKQF